MLVYDQSALLCKWASLKLFNTDDGFDPAKAIGVKLGDNIVAAVVYNNYVTDMNNNPLLCEMSIVSVDKRWATRYNLRALFEYPFHQLKLKRVQALCSANDEGMQMFLKRLGFTHEGTHREAYRDGGDAMSFAMLKNECKWINNG